MYGYVYVYGWHPQYPYLTKRCYLPVCRKNGISNNVGRILLTPIDYAKPDLTKPLAKPDLTLDSLKVEKKAAPLKGLAQFTKARKTTEEMYAEISNGAQMSINTWLNLIGTGAYSSMDMMCMRILMCMCMSFRCLGDGSRGPDHRRAGLHRRSHARVAHHGSYPGHDHGLPGSRLPALQDR